ncbi:PDR/VanB family oxidoreductase [Lacisediminihabitans sp. FW035]
MSSHETEFEAVVVSRSRAADSIEVFELARADGAALPRWQAGAHIDLVLPSGDERQYSLLPAVSPESPTWRIAVLREPSGRGGSLWLHDSLLAGASIRVRGPRNHFEFAPFPGSPVLLLAAGVGITPIASMARAAAASGIHYDLHYSGRSRSALALLDEVGEATLHLSDEGTRLDVAELLESLDPMATIYACGPTRFIEAVEAAAGGHPLHVEHFEAKPLAAPVFAGDFEVELALSGETLTVPPDRSILEVVEEAGVFVLSSCREGTCGTCETPVIEGDVDHRDSILTPLEQEQNAVMYICVSRAACPRLVLEL